MKWHLMLLTGGLLLATCLLSACCSKVRDNTVAKKIVKRDMRWLK